MQSVIENYLYDTNKARLVATASAEKWHEIGWGYGEDRLHLHSLYESPGGRWFLHRRIYRAHAVYGPRSWRNLWIPQFVRWDWDELSKETLETLTLAQAQQFCIDHAVDLEKAGVEIPEAA